MIKFTRSDPNTLTLNELISNYEYEKRYYKNDFVGACPAIDKGDPCCEPYSDSCWLWATEVHYFIEVCDLILAHGDCDKELKEECEQARKYAEEKIKKHDLRCKPEQAAEKYR